jgi:hypothetical protein
MHMKIRQIHPYGPPVGHFDAHKTDVAATIWRELLRMKLGQWKDPFEDQPEKEERNGTNS